MPGGSESSMPMSERPIYMPVASVYWHYQEESYFGWMETYQPVDNLIAMCSSGIGGVEVRIDRGIGRGRFQSMRIIR
jgi:hypothetical protein